MTAQVVRRDGSKKVRLVPEAIEEDPQHRNSKKEGEPEPGRQCERGPGQPLF